MKKLLTLTAIAAMVSSSAFAHNIEVGKALPSVTVEDGGVATIVDGDVEFNKWSTGAIKDGLILAQAARPDVETMTSENFKQQMNNMKNAYIIVNADDAPFGAGPFIAGGVAEGKLKTPTIETILDDEGIIFEELELAEESVAIIIVRDGKVAFIHEGQATPELEAKALELMN